MIAFRISEEDYERLYSVCESLGARSVSDLARSAMSRLIRSEREGGDPLIGRLEVLTRDFVQLKSTVEELSSRLADNERPKPATRLPD
jgi:hypothetical protein